jgi:hypothetical protein
VASALKKMQERDEEVDPEIITNYLTKGRWQITILRLSITLNRYR